MIREAIGKLVNREALKADEAEAVMKELMSGSVTKAQMASFLTALRMKGESIEEITAFAKVMKEFCCQIHPNVRGRIVDIVGTGGDSVKTFNVSTISAFVVAGSGLTVAKHGNRSVTSRCGSADLLERLGYKLDTEVEVVEKAIESVGIGFMFAPKFHPAMKHVAEVRKEMGIRTVFNILGPLTNPASANAMLLGVYDQALIRTMASVLGNLGSEEAMVVHGLDGVDEISTLGRTEVAWLRDGGVKALELSPRDFGVRIAKPEEISGTSVDEGAEVAFSILKGIYEPGDARMDLVLVNAAAGLIIGGQADGFREAMELASESVKSGAAYDKLRKMIEFCRGDMARLEGLEAGYG